MCDAAGMIQLSGAITLRLVIIAFAAGDFFLLQFVFCVVLQIESILLTDPSNKERDDT